MSEHSDSPENIFSSDALVLDLAGEWRALARGFSLDKRAAADAALGFLLGRYAEKHRCYHNLNHVRALLVLAAGLEENISDYDCVRLAIWFHDAIYDPQRKDNEIESAKLAVWYLSRLGLPKNKVQSRKDDSGDREARRRGGA